MNATLTKRAVPLNPNERRRARPYRIQAGTENFKLSDILGGEDDDNAGGTAGSAVLSAAGTAIAPGVGTLVGAALGNLVSSLFGGGHSSWTNAGAGVHEWFTKYGDQAFLDWMRKERPDDFGNLDTVKALRIVWIFGLNGSLYNPDAGPEYAPAGGLAKVYASMGIDYPATVSQAISNGHSLNNLPKSDIVMLPGGGSAALPQAATDEAKDAAARVAAGQGTKADFDLLAKLKAAAKDIARAASEGASEGVNAGGGVNVSLDLKELVPWIIGGLLVLLLILWLVRK